MKRRLVLAQADDRVALRVYLELCSRYGERPVKLVSPEELVLAPRWEHRLQGQQVTTAIRLADGSHLCNDELGVVFNRLRAIRPPQFDHNAADHAYAQAEMEALLWSWLASLPCPVINRPVAGALALSTRSPAQWLQLASRAGLPARRYQFSSDPRRFHPAAEERDTFSPHTRPPDMTHTESAAFTPLTGPPVQRQPTFYLETPLRAEQRTVVVAGERVLGALPMLDDAVRRLARLADCDLLQLTFAPFATAEPSFGTLANSPSGSPTVSPEPDETWKVCTVGSFPTHEDPPVITAIANLLDKRLQETTQPA